MRRHILGILAIVLIVVGVSSMSLGLNEYLANSCWRIGIVLLVLWLALPQLAGFSVWFRRAAIVVALIAAAFSKYGLILLPLIFLMWIFNRRKPTQQFADASKSEAAPPASDST